MERLLTGREESAQAAAAAAVPVAPRAAATPVAVPLPEVSVGGLAGLLEILAARGGEDGLAELADELSLRSTIYCRWWTPPCCWVWPAPKGRVLPRPAAPQVLR